MGAAAIERDMMPCGQHRYLKKGPKNGDGSDNKAWKKHLAGCDVCSNSFNVEYPKYCVPAAVGGGGPAEEDLSAASFCAPPSPPSNTTARAAAGVAPFSSAFASSIVGGSHCDNVGAARRVDTGGAATRLGNPHATAPLAGGAGAVANIYASMGTILPAAAAHPRHVFDSPSQMAVFAGGTINTISSSSTAAASLPVHLQTFPAGGGDEAGAAADTLTFNLQAFPGVEAGAVTTTGPAVKVLTLKQRVLRLEEQLGIRGSAENRNLVDRVAGIEIASTGGICRMPLTPLQRVQIAEANVG